MQARITFQGKPDDRHKMAETKDRLNNDILL